MRIPLPGLRSAGRAMTVTALAIGTVLGTAGTALAGGAPVPQADDSRAYVTPPQTNPTQCSDVNLPGTTITGDAAAGAGIRYTVDQSTYVTITAIPDGLDVSGVVVKGSDAANVYLVGKLGPLPWKVLHAPTAGHSGAPATISHWFLCASDVTRTTTPTPPPSTTTPGGPAGTTTASPTTTGTHGGGPTTTTGSTTTTPAVAGVGAGNGNGGTKNLAETGFDNAWLIWVGGLLLLGGIVMLLLLRTRWQGKKN